MCQKVTFEMSGTPLRVNIPGAPYVAHAFCSVCGSGLPRFDVAHRIAIVPIGSFEETA